MRQKSLLTVQKAGLAIYLFSLALGIYFSAKTTMESGTVKSVIVSVLIVDNDTPDDQDAQSKKKFGSRFVSEEDDDDSARNLYCESIASHWFASFAPLNRMEGYISNPRSIINPPPQS